MLYLHYETNASQAKIGALLASVGIRISVGTVAGMLSAQPASAAESEAICRAGLASSPYQHLDARPTRLNGEEWQCHVLGSPLYVSYHTVPGKDRLAVLDVLRLGAPRTFAWNAHARAFLAAGAPLPGYAQLALAALPEGVALGAAAFRALLYAHLPGLGPQQRGRVLDVAAIGAYRARADVPVVQTLVVDAAPQFGG